MQARQALEEVRKMLYSPAVDIVKPDQVSSKLLDSNKYPNKLELIKKYRAEIKKDHRLDELIEIAVFDFYLQLRQKDPNEVLSRSFLKDFFYLKLKRQKTLDNQRKFLADEIKKASLSKPEEYNLFLKDCLMVLIQKDQNLQLIEDVLAKNPVLITNKGELEEENSIWHYVAGKQSPQLAKRLLKANQENKQVDSSINPFSLPARDSGNAPIVSALIHRNFPMFQYLLNEQKISSRTKNNDGNSLLHQLIDTAKPGLDTKENNRGQTLDEQFLDELLTWYPGMADEPNIKNKLPLQLAIKNGNFRMTRALLCRAATLYPIFESVPLFKEDRSIPNFIKFIAEGSPWEFKGYRQIWPDPTSAVQAAALVLAYSGLNYSEEVKSSTSDNLSTIFSSKGVEGLLKGYSEPSANDLLHAEDRQNLLDVLRANVAKTANNAMSQWDLPVCLTILDKEKEIFSNQDKSDELSIHRFKDSLQQQVLNIQQNISDENLLQLAKYITKSKQISPLLGLPICMKLFNYIHHPEVQVKFIDRIYELTQENLANTNNLDLNPILKELMRRAILKNDGKMLTVLSEFYQKNGNKELYYETFAAVASFNEEMKQSKTVPTNLLAGLKQAIALACIPDSKQNHPPYLVKLIKEELSRREKEVPIKDKIISTLEKISDKKPIMKNLEGLIAAHKPDEKASSVAAQSDFVNTWNHLRNSARDWQPAMKLLIYYHSLIQSLEQDNSGKKAIPILFACFKICEQNKVGDAVKNLFLKLLGISSADKLKEFRNIQPVILANLNYEFKLFKEFLNKNPREQALFTNISTAIVAEPVAGKASLFSLGTQKGSHKQEPPTPKKPF